MNIKKAVRKSEFKPSKNGEFKYIILIKKKPIIEGIGKRYEGNYKNMYIIKNFEKELTEYEKEWTDKNELDCQIEEILESQELKKILKKGERAEYWIMCNSALKMYEFSLEEMRC